jgi:hypothetical protein
MSIFIERIDKLLDGTGSMNPSGDLSPVSGDEAEEYDTTDEQDAGAGVGEPLHGTVPVGLGAGVATPATDSAVPHAAASLLTPPRPALGHLSALMTHSDDDSSTDSSTVPPQFGIVEPLLFRGEVGDGDGWLCGCGVAVA